MEPYSDLPDCIIRSCFSVIDLPPSPGSTAQRSGLFLTLRNLHDELDRLINYFNSKYGKDYNIQTKAEEIRNNLRHNMSNCFPAESAYFLNFNYEADEQSIKSPFYQKIYAFLLDENLNLISSLTVHFFKDQDGHKYHSKIHDVCVAPNQSGTKILMLNILERIKPISETIWLNVIQSNTNAYNLYLDIGFEFVFNNKTDLLDMIYVEKQSISSRGNDVLFQQRQNIINDMVNYKIYLNYINRIGDKLVPAVRTQYYPPQEEKQTEEEEKNIIENFMQHVYDFITPNYMEVEGGYDLKYNRPQPVLVFTKHGKAHYLFINSLVNNIDNFNEDLKVRFEGTLRYILNTRNINNEDLKILFRTLFPIKTTVTITNEEVHVNPVNSVRTYNHTEHLLNLNLFVIIDQYEITTYNYQHIVYPITGGDIYNIDIDTLQRIHEIDLYVKYALYHEQTDKICVKIPKNIDINLRMLYYRYNLLPSYSACPYKPNTFVYNTKRFNNINNRFWELDSFDFNNLYVFPNATLDQQPITKDTLSKISGCINLNDTLENYFVQYLDYLKPSTSSTYKVYFLPGVPNEGTGIILSFLGYLILQCNKNFIDQMITNNNLTYDLTTNNIDRWVKITPFLTLNHYNSDSIKPDLIHNINIFCHSRIVNYMSSLCHGSMLSDIRTLERGQKLIMYTRPNNLFYMINLNYNFMTLIFDDNNIQRLFDCIELLSNVHIPIITYFDEYREIIKALLANISHTEGDIYLYTQYYNDHYLLYNEEVMNWVNYPISIGQHLHYEGTYIRVNDRQIRLNGYINPNKINSNFSLDGLYVNFNKSINTTSNRVHAFNLSTLTVTLTEDIGIYNPFVTERVIIGTLPYYYRHPSPDSFYDSILSDSHFNGCNRDLIRNHLVTNDASLTNFTYSNNFEINNQTYVTLSQNLFNTLRTTVGFPTYFNNEEQIKNLSYVIIYRKLLEGKNSIHQKPSSIETNNGITFNDFTQRDITNNAYIKQHISNNSTVNLSTLLDKKLKYNSFICCRGVQGGAIFNPVQLPGEIRVSDIINRRKVELNSL